MQEQEGVIKYNLKHKFSPLEKSLSLANINAWRTLLFKLELIGQIEGRYNGYGFGNISQRLESLDKQNEPFVISGSQTGNLEILSNHHYCIIDEADINNDRIKSRGEVKPSSEALTHASVYLQNKSIQSVIHVHNAEIWNNTHKLTLPHTSATIPYGTPQMAKEVAFLFKTAPFQNTGIFSMLGHIDGIVAFSDSLEKAAFLIIKHYAKALELEKNDECPNNL